MNLDQLEAVNAVVEKGSFRAAAEFLHRSQPALSVSIKNLEDEFQFEIFDRSDYRPKLTKEGKAFLSVAKAALSSAQYANRVGIELGKQQTETELCIFADPLISIEFLELIALECARPILPVNLIVRKSILSGGQQALLDGEVDLAIAPRSHMINELEAIPLEEVTLVAVISRKLLQEKKQPTEDFLKKNPQIILYDRNFDGPRDSALPSAVFEESGHKIYVPDHSTKVRLIDGGVGWGRITSTEIEKASKELVEIDKSLCPDIKLDLCLMRPKTRPIGLTARSIWEFFKKRSKE